ncbi:MAG: hypothetical protein QM493_11085 [Sulfurovum sp.]
MYSNDDLNEAIKEEIFTQESVDNFRNYVSTKHNSPLVDEENFKLLSGFNDIFVVIATWLLLGSVYWITAQIDILLAMVVLTVLSWGLAEFFVRQRKMALPSIVLMGTFISSIFFGLFTIFVHNNILYENNLMISAGVTGIATYLHWRRFAVPITVAFGMSVFIVFTISLLISIYPPVKDHWAFLTLFFGLMTFYVAMYWDSKDTKRLTKNSDVAFWLHLLSAPLIVHSIFTLLGIFDSTENGLDTLIAIIILYIFLSSVSLIVDRRAFMVSSLAYVIYALNSLFNNYGIDNNSFAITGVLIGFSLLLLSAYWQNVRNTLLNILPDVIRRRVP